VYIADKSRISGGSLAYALFFFGLFLVAHLVARFTVPHADPYVLPIAALLAAVGVTEIYRLGPKDAFRQGTWVVIGVAVFALALLGLRRDYRILGTTSACSGSARSRCSSYRCCRGSGCA
jgi:4-amino-4-deoxy-L-arabinose transferase-like glycosyltransferase